MLVPDTKHTHTHTRIKVAGGRKAWDTEEETIEEHSLMGVNGRKVIRQQKANPKEVVVHGLLEIKQSDKGKKDSPTKT